MAYQPPPPGAIKDRVIRVFVSSTFRDMQEERDYLVKHIFPELRKRCRERQVEFVEVDLRWGVTEEQANRGEVLPICLREIELCRPYFVGLLGERYGWVPDKIDPQLLEEQPWLTEHREHSVTELEILHGVLRNPQMADRSYFYFRDRAYIEKLPPERWADYCSENPAAQAKLVRLKDRIRQSGLPFWEDYPHPQALGELILEDLWCAIDQEYPQGTEPDDLTRQAMEHEAFAASRAKVYIGRQEYYHRLDRHASSEDPPLVILGESGVGKSALMTNWAQHYRQAHPEDFVFFHFIGATPKSTDYVGLLHRIISEIKRCTEDPEEVSAQPDNLRETLPLWLAKAAAWAGREQCQVIIILDALNQLEDRDNAPDLGWLPEYFPPPVRVILSTLPGRPLAALEKRGWPTSTVAQLEPAEMQQVIREYLGIYRKTLDAPLVEEMVAAPQAANPLYLKAILDELRIFGIFEKRGDYLHHYLTAPDPPALYGLILKRLEQDYEKPRPGLVGEALQLIGAARRGLSESELLELLGTQDGPLPRTFWSPLALALEDSLVSRSGLLTFFHDYLRQAVQARYLTTSAGEPDQEAEQNIHLRLADYFEKRDLDDRKADELPWQLRQAQAWERLKDCLTGREIFLSLMTETRQYELLGYWLALKESGQVMVKAYQAAIPVYQSRASSKAELAHVLTRLASLFKLCGNYQEASSLFNRVLAIYEKVLGPEHPDVAASLNNLAGLCLAQGHFPEAEPLYWRALVIVEKAMGPEHQDVANSLVNLAALYHVQRRFPEAEPLYRRALAIREKVLGPEHSDTGRTLFLMAQLFRDKGEHSESARLYHCLIDTCNRVREQGGLIIPEFLNMMAASYNNLAFHTEVPARNWPTAEEHYRRALELFQQFGQNLEAANVELNLQAMFHLSGQPVDKARVQELSRILEEAGDKRAEKGRKLLAELP